ncbi:MAG TPA: protease inhibitor I42 family protein [Myxococcaceae bacterium]|nr:protease inhibitor I42 family protein [Myxococcaceae bacterium]
MTVDETSNGQQLSVEPGEALEICLSEIRTEGYHWDVEECGEPNLSLESERFYAPRHLPTGKHIWRFRAQAPGEARVRLSYRHSWNDAAPLQVYEVVLSVQDASVQPH